ncbi:myocilin opposite strand protein [Physeter macrocephalus]|uniref:Myocilin opposite strand protein n=1 Tax=Physeter macrocephalus TaxID=9755 RepID=A0A455B576_PHYMC|nr:myocilin opposite strand protein [Physeter catodon]XP_058913675.1 myocilin opposite strand protein [Kogia breviceps]|eukprot:XP_028343937.1 myocilin opposite strand protein-like [Physeter catodon]
MAEKGSMGNSINLPYRDLASEVTRRRITMTMREERFTKKSDEAGEIPSDMDLGQAHPPSAAGSEVPPAPPPSPTEDSKVSFLST